MQTFKKIVRYVALALVVVGIILLVYGSAVNQVALRAFLSLLNERGFKAFIVGILLVVLGLALLIASFGTAKDKDAE